MTKHLQVLERTGLVTSLRVGRESQFAYRPEPISEVLAYLDRVSAHCDDALARLRAL